MDNLDPNWLLVFSDLFVNLAAGWIGAVVIVPNFSKDKGWKKFGILTVDVLGAIVCLAISFKLRSSV